MAHISRKRGQSRSTVMKSSLILKISTIRYLSLRIVKWYHDVEIIELEQQHGSIG